MFEDSIWTRWISLCSFTIFIFIFLAGLSVMAVSAGAARGHKERVRERIGQGKGQREGGQMERLLGKAKRGCVTGAAGSSWGGKKRKTNEKEMSWINESAIPNTVALCKPMPSELMTEERGESFRLIEAERETFLSLTWQIWVTACRRVWTFMFENAHTQPSFGVPKLTTVCAPLLEIHKKYTHIVLSSSFHYSTFKKS